MQLVGYWLGVVRFISLAPQMAGCFLVDLMSSSVYDILDNLCFIII